ncbi:hypothetical protein AU467_24060 [Mesorhizobium loti]|uniref:Uncharacterized protein n=1 Tax=Rhizobium loti TaxID=381 RepID=A0A101KS60_RHILI|nr:hypothetical protein AU467_24060 [Mesorhizobium loti]
MPSDLLGDDTDRLHKVLPLASDEAQFLTIIDKDAAGQLEIRKLILVRLSRLVAAGANTL